MENNTLDSLKIKNYCFTKEPKEWEGSHRMRKVLWKTLAVKGQLSKIYRELSNSTVRKWKNRLKNEHKFWRTSPKKT